MAPTLRAVIFSLGGTFAHFPAWDESAAEKWSASYDALRALGLAPPDREAYVQSMREAELAHWRRVETEQWSGPPTGIVREGFRLLDAVIDTLAEVPPLVTGWSR